jgi:hypothetical protein
MPAGFLSRKNTILALKKNLKNSNKSAMNRGIQFRSNRAGKLWFFDIFITFDLTIILNSKLSEKVKQ